MNNRMPIHLSVDLEPEFEAMELRILESIWSLERSLVDQCELNKKMLEELKGIRTRFSKLPQESMIN